MNGASLRDIAEILGHKTMQMTQRYSHLTQKYSSKVLSELNKRQFGN
jgi:site-specific recombinase XerD